MKYVLTLPPLMLIAGLSDWFGCVQVHGSGRVISETRTVDSFHSVELRGAGNIYVTQNKTSLLRLEAEDNIMPLLRTYVKNGVLVIDTEKRVRTTKSLNIYVTMPEILRLALAGSGNITGQSEITSDNLELAITGSGNITLGLTAQQLKSTISGAGNLYLKGQTASFITTITGSGNIEAFDLVTKNSAIQISGSGNAELCVSEELNATIAGSGDIAYKGNPKTVNRQIAGAGKLRKVN